MTKNWSSSSHCCSEYSTRKKRGRKKEPASPFFVPIVLCKFLSLTDIPQTYEHTSGTAFQGIRKLDWIGRSRSCISKLLAGACVLLAPRCFHLLLLSLASGICRPRKGSRICLFFQTLPFVGDGCGTNTYNVNRKEFHPIQSSRNTVKD